MSITRVLFLSILIASAGISADAATYYLDANAGDDLTGDGSALAPWQTLTQALAAVTSGDTVVLASGYYGPFEIISKIDHNWDLYDDWVTFTAAPDAEVEFESILLKPVGAVPSDPTQEGIFDAYLRFDRIHILDGVECNYARHWALVNCLLTRHEPLLGANEYLLKTAVAFRNGTDILIEGCEITHTGIGIEGRAHEVRLLNNHIHDGTHDGVRVTGWWNSLVEGNHIHGFDDTVLDDEADWGYHTDLIHIYIPGPARPEMRNHNVTFRNNVLYDAQGQGVQFNKYYASDVVNTQITFENNIFGGTKANIFNCSEGVDGLIFRHNSVIIPPTPRQYGRWTMDNYTVAIDETIRGIEFHNNILGSGGAPEPGAELLIYDYNLYQNPPSVPPVGVDDSRTYGRHALVGVDPMFANPDSFDGALDPASPAINYGTRVMAPTPIWEFDIHGTARDARPDLGAWEAPGLTPEPEPTPVIYDDEKTIFVDDFEDGHYADIDPWLNGPNTQGMSWHRPDPVDFKYYVAPSQYLDGSNAVIDPRGAIDTPRLAWLFSDQGGDWVDYDWTFDAANGYVVAGSGPMVLAQDKENYYWLEIGRDSGRLLRYLDGVETELAGDADIKLPHSGHQAYKIFVRHGDGEITISVDKHNDGTEDFTFTDTDPAAVARFTAGGVGFHTHFQTVHYRVQYDNIRVDVLASASAKPGDADGDGDVDLEDFVILKTTFGQNPLVDARADFDADGDVDLEDFVILKTNFGT